MANQVSAMATTRAKLNSMYRIQTEWHFLVLCAEENWGSTLSESNETSVLERLPDAFSRTLSNRHSNRFRQNSSRRHFFAAGRERKPSSRRRGTGCPFR